MPSGLIHAARMSDAFSVQAHYYCGMMLEAVHAVVHADDLINSASNLENDVLEKGDLLQAAGIYGRYGFFTACFAAEAGANALLEQIPKVSSSLVEDLEQMKTLNKFEIFALANGKALNRGDNRYEKMRQAIKIRNRFVHPKKTSVEIGSGTDVLASSPTKGEGNGRTYPAALDFFKPLEAIALIRDILQFISWVVFDTCGYSLSKGARLLSRGVQSTTGELYLAHNRLNFDVRSFGITGKSS